MTYALGWNSSSVTTWLEGGFPPVSIASVVTAKYGVSDDVGTFGGDDGYRGGQGLMMVGRVRRSHWLNLSDVLGVSLFTLLSARILAKDIPNIQILLFGLRRDPAPTPLSPSRRPPPPRPTQSGPQLDPGIGVMHGGCVPGSVSVKISRNLMNQMVKMDASAEMKKLAEEYIERWRHGKRILFL